ncbi:hypothetical protein BaRGS_00031815 [Batillaria attramentaria]|uniref:Uncharacterized protein n=1 Tax=Batillaria attramentaria TaxID=370345 RepID=A0ABD0JQF6_9CAEN
MENKTAASVSTSLHKTDAYGGGGEGRVTEGFESVRLSDGNKRNVSQTKDLYKLTVHRIELKRTENVMKHEYALPRHLCPGIGCTDRTRRHSDDPAAASRNILPRNIFVADKCSLSN